MLATLDDLKKQAINNIPLVQKVDFSKLKATSIPVWGKELKRFDLNLNQTETLLKQMNECIAKVETSQSTYKHMLLMENKVKFEPAAITDSKLLGDLSVIKRLEDQNGYYLGEVVDGKKNGKGGFHWKTGDKYIGEWQDGFMWGKGTYHWAATENRYQGEWKNHRREGRGVFHWSNGDRLEGVYVDGKLNGEAIVYFKDGRIQRRTYQNDELVNI